VSSTDSSSATSIWFDAYTVEHLATMFEHQHVGSLLGIQFVELGPDYLVGMMPVDDRHRQPYGLLHGGVSCVLAETLGSVASQLVIDPRKSTAVGIEINASHLRGVRDGHVLGRVSPIRIGKTLHVWEIRISDPAGRPVCISRLTVSILGSK
jgi:1,4-dihydroxy-2-naphthoyl-CoA hydrolase